MSIRYFNGWLDEIIEVYFLLKFWFFFSGKIAKKYFVLCYEINVNSNFISFVWLKKLNFISKIACYLNKHENKEKILSKISLKEIISRN
jgi:hypothetical protein